MLIALLGLSLFIMNMKEKEDLTWGDYKLTIGGKEIQGFAYIDPASPEGDLSTVSTAISKNGNITVTGTITINKKQIKELRKLCRAKKMRLPRKLKKKLKKEREKRIIAMNKNIIDWLDFYFPFGYRPRDLDKYLRCRCYVEPVTPPVPNEYLKRFTADDIEKMIKSFDNQPILPRDTGNRPGYIIIDDIE